MSTDIAESLPARKFKQAAMAKPEAKKEAPKGKSGGRKGASEEGEEKRIRQAVYDIRYRARREDIDLKAAFAQYMSNSSLSQAERTAVRAKLFGKEGGVSEKYINGADELALEGVANALYKVFVEKDDKEIELAYLQQLDEQPAQKYKVRVTDKNGRSYVRFADRTKITELRGNPNIESVEMTDHGEPYEGERRKGKATAKAKRGLDPVGKEDADVDNDGDVDKSDKYILNRRKKIGQAIRTRAEAYLADGTISTEAKPGTKKITGKDPMTGGPVDNYSTGAVTVSPDDGSKPVRKVGVYAHLELKGGSLSEAQLKMIKMYDDKKKKEEEELSKKDKVSSMMTKDSVKKEDEKEEEKPDMRSKYAMINIIKNKLRAAGQRDPMVMAVDACEENLLEKGMGPNARKIQIEKIKKKKPQVDTKSTGGPRFHTGHPVKIIDGKPTKMMPNNMPPSYYGGQKNKDKYQQELDKLPNPKPLRNQKKVVSGEQEFKTKKMKTEQTSVTGDGSKLSPKHLPGGPNSQYDIDGVPKTKKEKKKDTAPSYNIPTADNPKGGLRKKNDPKTYPSGIGEGP